MIDVRVTWTNMSFQCAKEEKERGMGEQLEAIFVILLFKRSTSMLSFSICIMFSPNNRHDDVWLATLGVELS